MSRTRVRRRGTWVVLTGTILASLWVGPLGQRLETSRPILAAEARVVVRPGDTLWSIAKRLAPGEDPRPLVDSIAASNRVDPGALVPGRTLVVPAG
jgi:hypothetical protein